MTSDLQRVEVDEFSGKVLGVKVKLGNTVEGLGFHS